MQFLRRFILFLIPVYGLAQPNFELREFTGKVSSIEPGRRFALERLTLTIGQGSETFLFPPFYGKMISEKLKIGDQVTLKANVNLRRRELMEKLSEANKSLSWYLMQDQILEIKIKDEWITLNQPKETKEPVIVKLFLDRKIVDEYIQDGSKKGLVFENGLVGFNMSINKYFESTYFNLIANVKMGDSISFIGYKMTGKEGYQYPIPYVNEVYHLDPLNKQTGELKSYLFKQNYVCIGARFKTKSGKDLMLSFPSDRAEEVKKFLDAGKELKIYYGRDFEVKFNLPELHAIIQDKDTLFIREFGFYGGADGKHEHINVEVKGKISRVNHTEWGSITNLIVASKYYVEIDAMMAQQLSPFFKKGNEITIVGKERVKKIGEIYEKDYRIVTPEKIIVNGKTFSSYKP